MFQRKKNVDMKKQSTLFTEFTTIVDWYSLGITHSRKHTYTHKHTYRQQHSYKFHYELSSDTKQKLKAEKKLIKKNLE